MISTSTGPLMAARLQLETSGTDLGLVLLLGLALASAAALARWLVRLIPMGAQRRKAVDRIAPVVAAAVGFVYLVLAARIVFDQFPSYVPIALILLLGAWVGISWFALRDFMAGVILRSGRVVEVGDRIEVDGVVGRVETLGLRTMTVQTKSGDEAVVPYGRAAQASIKRSPVRDGVSPYMFRLAVPEAADLVVFQRRVRETALISHWSSPVREPQVSVLGPGELEVTVYALDADHGPAIEATVRAGLGV